MPIRPLVRVVAAVIALGLVAAGCGEDNGPDFVPVGDAMRAVAGMERVDDFYSPPQLKVAETYEVTVHPAWSASLDQVCTVPTQMEVALARAGVDERVARLAIRYGDDGETYPYRWSVDLGPGRVSPERAEEHCRTLFALRDLPAGSSATIRIDRRRTEVEVHLPDTVTTDLSVARAIVSRLVAVPVDDLRDADATGLQIEVSIDPS
ncbi:MAG TPA: hypothetical protein VIR30_06900 [Nocardioides sp.]